MVVSTVRMLEGSSFHACCIFGGGTTIMWFLGNMVGHLGNKVYRVPLTPLVLEEPDTVTASIATGNSFDI